MCLCVSVRVSFFPPLLFFLSLFFCIGSIIISFDWSILARFRERIRKRFWLTKKKERREERRMKNKNYTEPHTSNECCILALDLYWKCSSNRTIGGDAIYTCHSVNWDKHFLRHSNTLVPGFVRYIYTIYVLHISFLPLCLIVPIAYFEEVERKEQESHSTIE